MATGNPRRVVDIARLRALLPNGVRTAARLMVEASGEADTHPKGRKAAIEQKRRQIQKWRAGHPDKPTGITARNAEALGAVLGVDPESFLVPLPTPEEVRIQRAERLEAQARALRSGQSPGEAATQP